MEVSEVCSLPGGVASVRKQFESQQTTPSQSVTQCHFHHTSAKQMSNSEVTASSCTNQVVPGIQQLNSTQETMVSYSDRDLASSYENHHNETEEECPRYTTKELRDHFERTIEEAAAHKPVMVRVPKSELCTVCRRRAYPMDALTVDKKKYHKSCFCCEHCGNKLSLGNYVSLHGHFYCLHHYKQLLKSKGNYDNGLGQKPPTGSDVSSPSNEKLERSYSANSIGSEDKTHSGQNKRTKAHCNKISVVWPPQADPPKKTFRIEEDIQLTKPQWPPPDNSQVSNNQPPTPKSPKHHHQKAPPRSVL